MSIAEKLTQIAENEQKVYNAGYEKGKAEGGDTENAYNEGWDAGFASGYDTGLELGEQAEYDKFWDAFQNNGTRTHYPHGFSWWDGEAFNPKHPIKISDIRTWAGSGDNIFEGFNNKTIYGSSDYELFDMSGFDIDFSGCKRIALPLAYAILKNLYLDLSNCTRIQQIFGAGNYVTYCDNITLKLGATKPVLTNPLQGIQNTTTLVLTEDSIIDCNGWSLQWGEKLSHHSIMSFINALEDKSNDTSGTTWIFTLGSTNLAKLTQDEIQIAEQKGWNLQ